MDVNKSRLEVGVVANTYNPSLEKQRPEDWPKCEAS